MSSSPRDPIAIVGIGCRFPGAEGPAAFWRLLKNGIDVVGRVPRSRFDADALFDPEPATPGKVSTEWGGFLDHIEDFDAEFFGISPREAERLDPQQRLLLETSWEALEDGGLVPDRLHGTQTGVFVGMWINEYEARLFRDPRMIDFYMTIGSGRYSAAGRLSYFFGLQGPSLTVDTGCSASLVAVHLACQSLWSGETTVALAAGVNAILEPNITIAYSQSRMMATDGRCKFGDARADGYVRSEGAGVVVLKPLARAMADGDRIYATILGSAVNNDGRTSGFLTTPGAAGQEEMLRLAYRHAGVSPGAVDYVEAHGTGTRAGDPVEINALGAVLAEGRQPGDVCRLGSVKTNIGHTEGAAGVAGLIKVALSLRHRQLPPSLHLQSPNPDIAWDTLPVTVQRTLEPWPAGDHLPIAGVSSFGISGTNAHVVLQGAPVAPDREPHSGRPVAGILPISARSADALRAQLRQFRDGLNADADTVQGFEDLCWTASTRRTHHEHRTAVVARGRDELATQLDAAIAGEPVAGVVGGRATERRNRIVFVFPGQGSQWLGMGRQLLESAPAFRRALEICDQAVQAEAGWSVIEEMQASDAHSRMQDIGIVQPLLFSIEVALAALWRSRGFEPSAVVGHSMGEVAAAAVAGALSIEQAVQVVCRRSDLLRRVSGQGAMAVVELSLADARLALAGREQHLSVAVSNSSRSTVIAGDPAQLDALIAELEARETFCRRIKVDVASHSPQMDPLRTDLLAALDGLQPTDPSVPMYSTLSGHPDGAALDADYWVRNLRAPVLFSDAIQRLIADGYDTFIEMSPHPILLPAIEEGMRESAQEGLVAVPSLRRGEDEDFALMTAVAMIWNAGYPVSWDRVIGDAAGHADLPAYPWQRQRFWFDAPSQMDLVTGRPAGAARDAAARHPLIGQGVSVAGDRGARVWEFDLDQHGPRTSMAYSAGGKVIVPASTWLDLIIAAGRELGAGTRLALTDVVIEPLALTAPTLSARLQVVARAEGPGRFACGIYRRTEDGWIRHVAAVLHLNGQAAGHADPPHPDALGEPRDGADAYAMLEKSGSSFGAPLQAITRWWTAADHTVAGVELPQVCAHEESRYWLHPAVIDAALQAASLDRYSALPGSAPCLPNSIARVEMYAGAEQVAWAVASRSNDGGDDRYDVTLLDDGGATRVRLTGLQVAPLAADSRASGVVNDWLYRLEWKESAPVGQPTSATQGGTWLIASAADELTGVLTARFGSGGFGSRDAHRDLESAITAAAGDPGGCAGVIFVAGPTTGHSGSSSGPARAALELATRLSRQDGDRPRVWFVTRGSQPVSENERVSCEHAAVWGIGRTFAEEHPGLWGGLIDLDPASTLTSAAEAVFATVTAAGDGEDQVAFRGDRRFALRLVRAAIAPNHGIGLRANATYVIAGGLGALGLKVAHWMVESGARRLLLLGRTAMPARHDWDKAQGNRDRERILAIRKMEALGASVRTAAVDITDVEELGATVGRMAAEGWPPIAGIIQCAGVLQGRLVGDGNDQDFEDVWRPKAQGTRNLDAIFAGQPLDFFVVFSSMASFLPSAGQASYAAANCFLDAFAADLRAAGRPVIAVNWGPWADVGMAAELSTRGALGVSSRGFANLDASQALTALSRVIAAPACAQTAVMAFDWRQWSRGTAALPLFADLAAADDTTRRDAPPSAATAANLHSQIAAAGTALERRTIIEGILRDQVAQVLKRSAATIELIKPFRAMGLDSLMALEFRNRLEALAGVRLPATLAFNYPTIAALAPFLASKAGFDLTDADPSVAETPDDSADDVERMLAEIEQLSDADVRRLTLEEK